MKKVYVIDLYIYIYIYCNLSHLGDSMYFVALGRQKFIPLKFNIFALNLHYFNNI